MKLRKFILICVLIGLSVFLPFILLKTITYRHNEKLNQRIDDFYNKLDKKLKDSISFCINTTKKTIIQYDTSTKAPEKMLSYLRNNQRAPRYIEFTYGLPFEYKPVAVECCFVCKFMKSRLFYSLYRIDRFMRSMSFGSDFALLIFIESSHLAISSFKLNQEVKYELNIPFYNGSMATRKLLVWYLRNGVSGNV